MRPEKLLLLDLSPECGACEQLRSMLETTFQVKVMPLGGVCDATHLNAQGNLVDSVRDCDPALIFLILSRPGSARTAPPFQTIFTELTDLDRKSTRLHYSHTDQSRMPA